MLQNGQKAATVTQDDDESDSITPGTDNRAADDETHGEPVAATDSGGDAESDELRPNQTSRGSHEATAAGSAQSRRVSVSVRTLVVGALFAVLLGALGFVTWLYVGAKAEVDQNASHAANIGHAEQVAIDYAVGAARIDIKDLNAWKINLVKGTTPELKEKLDKAASSMEQILVPLQWDSTAVPLAAKVRLNTNGVFVVDTFVGVNTKTVQTPEGLQSTATYSITIDSNRAWQISDVGGVGAVLNQK
jgi:Mce-associated membrane protein